MAKFQDTVETVFRVRDEARDQMRQAERERMDLARKEQRRAQEEAQRSRQLADTKARIREEELRAEGRVGEAAMLQARRRYAQQIREARAAGDRELAERTRTLARLEQANQQALQEQAATTQGFIKNFQRGFEVLALSFVGELSRAFSASLLQATQGSLEDIANTLERIPGGLGGIVATGRNIREIEAIERIVREDIRNQQTRLKLVQDRAAAESTYADAVRRARQELQIIAAPDAERERLRIIAEEQNAVASLEERLRAARAERARTQRDSGAAQQDTEAERRLFEIGDRLETLRTGLGFIVSRQTGAIDAEVSQLEEEAARLRDGIELRRQQRQQAADLVAQLERQVEVERELAQAQARDRERQRQERVAEQQARQAEEQARQREIAEKERVRQIERETEEARRRTFDLQRQALEDQRAAADRDLATLAERLELARQISREQQAPNNQLNANERFLTGVREISASRDRGRANESSSQERKLEEQVKELQAVRRGIDQMVRELTEAFRNGPRIVGANLR